ncbi:MAG TPA: CehA/McbA family metallohydrolase [Bryobacteraceae bacterium]|nr:CehA/McbA family metallohydrolase [Bryobacteraceae bacterium]
MAQRRDVLLRLLLILGFALALGLAQIRDSLRPAFAASLDVAVMDASTGRITPARVYLFKDGRPSRLSPVDALLPLRVDLYYRERLWKQVARPKTLEVTASDQSHFFLLDGQASFDLPAGKYRLEAYRGIFFKPASVEFELKAGESRRVELKLQPVAPDKQSQWLSGDDHIHLVRDRQDNDIFLRWLQAEDLSVANFLQLQRQSDAGMQYGFGEAAEARLPGFSIRSGEEARSHFYGHINLLGLRELLRPVSVGEVYANSPEAYPFPLVMFERARRDGCTVGYAHFDGSQKHSTLLMDLALGTIDFVEVFQFGVLKTDAWYQLLNAGLRVTGIAGSDFPVPLGNRKPWPQVVPLLGPERTLVKASAGRSAYEAWAEGVRKGEVVVSNGPLLELEVNGKGPGASIAWEGSSSKAEGVATVTFHRPIEKLEIVVNGEVAAVRGGNGTEVTMSLPFAVPLPGSSWIAARAKAKSEEGEPELLAHTNPVYLLRNGLPVSVQADRAEVAKKWEAEAEYYRSSELTFQSDTHRRELLEKVERALAALRQPGNQVADAAR